MPSARLILSTAGLAAATVAALLVSGTTGASASATTLGAAAAGSGRTFGAVVDSRRLATDAQYRAIVDREFTSQTSEPELNWDQTQPTRGTFNFSLVDPMLATLNGRRLRGHALVWPGRLPAWASQGLTTPDFARTELRNHISTVVARLRGHVDTWDVVNEAFADDGTRRKVSFQLQLGDGWIAEAFRAARAADPDARLCYDDYWIEDAATAKAAAVYELVRSLKADGVPIDCVGFESHFRPDRPVTAGFRANLQRFADLGVDVELTELDAVGADAGQYTAAVNACLAVPRCTRITVSAVRDRDTFRLGDAPALWDVDGNVKPTYASVLAALDTGGPTTTTTPITTTTTTTTRPTTTTRTCRPRPWWPHCR